MPLLYDGSVYHAPHSNLVAANRPLDAMAEHLHRGNALWLLDNGQWFEHGLWRQQWAYDAATGDRAYASAQKTCWFVAPYYVQPTLDALDVVICGRVQTQAVSPISGSNKVTVWAELAGVGEVKAEFSATSNYSDLRLTIPITNRPARPFVTQLRLWVKSEITEEVDTGFRGTLVISPDIVATNAGSTALEAFYPAETYPAPSSSTYGEHATTMEGQVMDHIYRRTESQMVVYPPNTATGDMALVRLSYLQTRGFALKETHDVTLYPPEEIRALIPLLGQSASQPAAAYLTALTRPQLVSLGHPGQLDYARCTGADLPEGYTTPFQWRTVTAGEGSSTIHRQPLWLDEADAEIEVRVLYVPVYVLPDYQRGEFDTLNAEGVGAEWTFSAGLVEYVDASGDPVTLGTGESEAAITHLPTDTSGVWPLLVQRRWAAGLLGDDYAPADERPTYKEGQLFGPDMALVREAVVRVSLTDAPTDKAACIEVSALQTGTLDFNAPTYATNPTADDRVQLVVVGLSIWAKYPGRLAAAAPTPYTGKAIASEAAIPTVTRFVVGQPVRAADWLELGAQANRLWARRGARGVGRWFEEATDLGEPWVTQSTSYVQISGYTDANERLSNFCGPAWALHHVEPDSGKVRVTLEAHGRAIDLQVGIYALDTGALLDTLTVSASDWELMSDTVELTVAASHEGGSTANPKRLVLLKIEARTNGVGTTARLTYWQLREEPITDTADLPR